MVGARGRKMKDMRRVWRGGRGEGEERRKIKCVVPSMRQRECQWPPVSHVNTSCILV